MKRSSGGYRALQFERIVGAGTRAEGYADGFVYAIEGVPGLYRRVAKPKVSDFGSVGVVPAFYGDGTLYYLKLDAALEVELADAGLMFGKLVGDTLHEPELPDDVARANLKARELYRNPPATLLSSVEGEGTATGGAEGEAPTAPRKRAAGSKITKTTAPPLPPITDANGEPLPGSLAAEGLGADPVSPATVPPPPAAVVSIHDQIAAADAPPDAAPVPAPAVEAEPAPPPGQVSATTGMAPAASLDW